MTTVSTPAPSRTSLIRWHHLYYVSAALVVMIVAIVLRDLWFLNYVHVLAGLMWTGIDLFMGFVVGPMIRRLAPETRRQVVLALTPRTLFLLPTLATITGTTGWYLAVERGYTQLEWPHYGWVAAALALTTLMAIQGTGFLLPTNLRVCMELAKEKPDHTWIARTMSRFYYVVGLQGVMQMLIIIIMARFATGI